jgi:carboxyl-terminal processing protease
LSIPTFVDGTFNHTNWKATRQQLLSKNYSSNEQAYSAIRAALKTLNDPNTRFLDPNQFAFAQQNQQFSGELTGIGAKLALDKKTKVLTVIASMADSPAFRAGLKPGDQVLEVNGTSVNGLDVDKAVTLIRGKSGTLVKLKITRPRQKTFDITLTRQAIKLSAITSTIKQEGRNRIGYIRLSEFTDHADIQMKEAIQSLEKQNVQAFVLDLRQNSGGLERIAVAISRLWINDGRILSTVDRVGNSRSEEANHSAITNLPLVVLVDGGWLYRIPYANVHGKHFGAMRQG